MIGKKLFLLTILAMICQQYSSEACGLGCLACGTNECNICDSENFYVKSVNGSCVKKEIDNCAIPSTDREDMVCYQCVPGFALNQNGKNCQEVPSRLSIPNCLDYHWDFSCLACKTKFYLNNERKCEESPNEIENCDIYKDAKVCAKCAAGYFYNIGSSLCEKINEISQCKVYSSIECQKCSNGYFQPKDLSSGNALTPSFLQAMVMYNQSEDADLIYENSPVNDCAPGSVANCMTHSSSDVCAKCESGYFRNFEGRCLEYPVRAIAFCTVYEDSETCKTCKNGYYLEKNKCYSLENIDGCLEFDTSEQLCLKCHTPTHFLSAGICNLRNHSANVKFCQNLSPTKDECDSCFSSFKITDDKLFCLPHVAHCQDYISDTDPNSDDFTNINTIDHICETCEDGFYLLTSNRKCVPQDKIGCVDFTENTNDCTECAVSYFLDGVSCSKNTATNCKTFSITANECVDCVEGYFKNGPNCQKYTAKNCLAFSSSADECATCNFGYVMSSDSTSCIASVYINCLTVDSNNQCDSCPLGYFIKEGNCLPVSLRHCLVSDTNNDECATCEYGYFKDSSNKCHPYTAKHCLTYSTSADECDTCDTSNYYKDNGQCLKYTVRNCNGKSATADECTACQTGYFKNDANHCLLNKFKHCNATDVSSSTEFCTSCKAGYLLKDDICVALAVPGCVRYSNTECTKCRDDLWLNTGTKTCDIRTKNNCKKESPTADECISCFDHFKLNSGSCEVNTIAHCKVYVDRFDAAQTDSWGSNTDNACETCSLGYYKTVTNTCSPQAINFCKEYVPNANQCAACLPGFIKSADGSTCDGNFDTPTCAIYDQSSPPVCITCRNGYKLDTSASGNRCLPFTLITDCIGYFTNSELCQYCIAGKLPNDINTACVDIPVQSQCARMRPDEPKCLKCNSGHYLTSSGTCIAQSVADCSVYKENVNECALCTNGKVVESATGFCIDFSDSVHRNIDNCLHYSGDFSQCVICMAGYYANSEGKCAIQNSEGCAVHKANSTECLTCHVNYIMSNSNCIERVDDPNCAVFEDNSQDCKICIGSNVLNQATKVCEEKHIHIGSNITYDIKCHEDKTQIDLSGSPTNDEKAWSSSMCTTCTKDYMPQFKPSKFFMTATVTNCAILTDYDNCSQCKPGNDVTETAGKYDCSAVTPTADISCTQIVADIGAATTQAGGSGCVDCLFKDKAFLDTSSNPVTCKKISDATDYGIPQFCAELIVSTSPNTYSDCAYCKTGAVDRKGKSIPYECVIKNVMDLALATPKATNTDCKISTHVVSSPDSWQCQLCTTMKGGVNCEIDLEVQPFYRFGSDFMQISGDNDTASTLLDMEVYLNQTDKTDSRCKADDTDIYPRPLMDLENQSPVSYSSNAANAIHISFFNEYHKYSCINGFHRFAASVALPMNASSTSLVTSYQTATSCGAYYNITQKSNIIKDETDSTARYACYMCPDGQVPTEIEEYTQMVTASPSGTAALGVGFPYNAGIKACTTAAVTITNLGTISGADTENAYYGMGYTTGSVVPMIVGHLVNVNSCGSTKSLLVFGVSETDSNGNKHLFFANFTASFKNSGIADPYDPHLTHANMPPMLCIDHESYLFHPGATDHPTAYNANTMLSVDNCQVHFIDIGVTDHISTVVIQLHFNSGTGIEATSCLACMPGFKPTYDATTRLVTSCAAIANCNTGSTYMNACSSCKYDAGSTTYTYWQLDSNDTKILFDVCGDKAANTLGPNCLVMNNAKECVYCAKGFWLNAAGACVDPTTDTGCTTAGYSRANMADNTHTYAFLNHYMAEQLSNVTTDLSSLIPYCSACASSDLFSSASQSSLATQCTTSIHHNDATGMDFCIKVGSTSSVCTKCDTNYVLLVPTVSDNEGTCIAYDAGAHANCTKLHGTNASNACMECDSGYYIYPKDNTFASSTCKDESTSNCQTRRTSDHKCSLCSTGNGVEDPVSDLCVASSADTDCDWGAIDGSCLKCKGATYFPFHKHATPSSPPGDKIYDFECIDQSGDTTNIVQNADIFTRYPTMIAVLNVDNVTTSDPIFEYVINTSIRKVYDDSFYGTYATKNAAMLASFTVSPPVIHPCVIYPTSWVVTNCVEYNDNFVCIRCSPGKYVDTSSVPRGVCTDFHVEFCAMHDNNGFCLQCEFGYELQDSGKSCVKGTPNSVAECAYMNQLAYQSETCAVCNYGSYFVSDSECAANTAQNCLVKDTTSDACLSCLPGHVLNNGKCQMNYAANCLVPHQEYYGLCEECKSEYKLASGICVEDLDEDLICLETDQYGDCTSCPKGYITSGSSCEVLNPFSIEGCLQYYNGTLFCAECHSGLRLVNGYCLPPQEIANCEVMSGLSNWCLQCTSDYYVFAGNCLLRSNLNCRQFSSTEDMCVSCHSGYYLKDGECQERLADNCKVHRGDKDECLTCTDGFYLNKKSRVCVKNQAANCKTTAPFSNRCQSCMQGHYLTRAGSCRPHALENCQRASKFSNHCIECEEHYYLHTVDGSTAGDNFYYTDCVRYTARNCKTYELYSNNCATCHKGFMMMTTDVSITECVPILKDNCLNWSDKNSVCTECVDSHFLRDGNCFARKNQQCAKYKKDEDNCSACHPGMFLQQDLCYPYTVSNCATFHKVQDMCDSCESGFYLDNGKCVASTHSNCKSASPNKNSCLACEPFFYLQEGNCLPYKITCQTYDPTRNACLSCPSSSYLEPENKLCVPYTIKNCQEYNPYVNECLSCVDMHYLREGSCISYSVSTCKTYHPNYDECVSCHQGFYHKENNCLPYTVSNCSAFSSVSDNCHSCIDGHYLKAGNCMEYTLENCKNKNEFEDSCDLCEHKYYRKLVTHSLYICVSHTHVDECDSYNDSEDRCEACEEDYYLNLSLNKCIANPDAIAGCAEYVDKEHCGICSPPYYLNSGICLVSTTFIKNCEIYKEDSICQECEDKFLLSEDKLTCSGILEFSCETYLNPSNCKTCSGNKIISFYNSTDNTYISGLNGEDVSGRRAVCVDSGLSNCVKAIEHFPSNRCLICENNYYLNDNHTCQAVTEHVDNCEVYFNNGVCAQCLPNHVLSVDKETCSLNVSFLGPNCEEGKFYSEPNCFLCEKGYYLNEEGNCTQCEMDGCNVCLPETPKLCKLCLAGYYMNSDMVCTKNSEAGNRVAGLERADSGLEVEETDCDKNTENSGYESTSVLQTLVCLVYLAFLGLNREQ